MCLITKQICPIRARKDITVYKVLEKNLTNTKYITPFTRTPVVLHETLHARGKLYRGKCKYPHRLLMYEIGCGYIHCYTSLDTIHKFHCMGKYEVVVKCIIRKGTLYYKSHHGLQICATQVDILDEVIL